MIILRKVECVKHCDLIANCLLNAISYHIQPVGRFPSHSYVCLVIFACAGKRNQCKRRMKVISVLLEKTTKINHLTKYSPYSPCRTQCEKSID